MPRVDPHVLDTALDDVLLEHLIENPGRYDPRRGSLRNFLKAALPNRVLDLLRSNARRERHERPTGIDLSTVAGPAAAEKDEQQQMDDIRWIQTKLYGVVETEAERALVELKLANAPTSMRAKALGAGHLSRREQAKEVNRVWMRLWNRAKRSLKA
jgi:DNA-directed RNA polymerase specialized sigma24 family protein